MSERLVILVLALLMLSGGSGWAGPDARPQTDGTATLRVQGALAGISLYNPTAASGPVLVEIPVGRLAAPGAINWNRVRLVCQGREVPFAIHEGRAHWQAQLVTPIKKPRAEDLLVFMQPVPPGQWVRLDLVPGKPSAAKALARVDGRYQINYPGLQVAIDAANGLMTEWQANDQQFLKKPMGLELFTLKEGAIEKKGSFEHGYTPPTVALQKAGALAAPEVTLVSSSSSAAMTELNFVLKSEGQLALGLTYRIYAGGLVEISADERPWQDRSPWFDHSAAFSFALQGEAERLPYLENRWPFYGFKDYFLAVQYPAAIHRTAAGGVLELGEEIMNGRRWNRRIYFLSPEQMAKSQAMVELADEGLIVVPDPVRQELSGGAVEVVYPAAARVAAEKIAADMTHAGLKAQAVTKPLDPKSDQIILQFTDKPEKLGIEGDGFVMQPRGRKGGVVITANTLFGLTQATSRIAAWRRDSQASASLPLLAANPIVPARGSGPGGGNFEVDFPYGSDAEWERVFENMIDSGMNVISCMGMWSNWKMPVTYKYMPELMSDSPDAYDEMSGTKLKEIDVHRQHGLKLMKFLHERGVKVWLWIPIGCVPTTFAKLYPEAMCPPGNEKTPNYLHPRYQQYLDAYFKELLETYPIDGFFLVRDDNGGTCLSEESQQFLAKSRTKDPIWEQFLLIDDLLKQHRFKGSLAIYPYCNLYEPRLELVLPKDIQIVGHGSGLGMLSCDYKLLAPMGDQWIDNIYANFRPAPSPRMKRILADRSSFWAAGAYNGLELAWESIGYFGWEPTASVNTFRYQWGLRSFGRAAALDFVRFSDVNEHLWDINAMPLMPGTWIQLSAEEKAKVARDVEESLAQFTRCYDKLAQAVDQQQHAAWLAHARLLKPMMDNYLHRLQLADEMLALAGENKDAIVGERGLPEPTRQRMIAIYREIRERAQAYDREAATVPGEMMKITRDNLMTMPFREWGMAPFDLDTYLPQLLKVPQFDGAVTLKPVVLHAGQPFTLQINLRNVGVFPWTNEIGPSLKFGGVAAQLKIQQDWVYSDSGNWMVAGDERPIELKGMAPQQAGQGELSIAFCKPRLSPWQAAPREQKVLLRWE